MNRIYKVFLLIGLVSVMSACEMDYFPSDALSKEALLQDEKGLTYLMDGCYSVLKDQVEYLGYASGNDYCRHYFQLSEFTADNICLCAPTTDPLYQALSYTMTDDLKNVGTLWMLAYKVIGMSNTVIETIDKKGGDKQLQGEAYFLRALMHLHMVTLYAKPYNFGRENPGVPLRLTSADTPITRATVGQVYDQIVKDLQTAASLLSDKSRGNAGYPCKASALGLLSRVYLYMGDYTKVLDVINNQMGLAGSAIEANLEPTATFGTYFANAKTSKETLFCIAQEITDNKGQGSVGSMYNGADNGWGEIYPSNPLLYLYERYPSDVRYKDFIVPQYNGSDIMCVYFPAPKPESDHSSRQTMVFPLSEDGEGGYYFTDSLKQKCSVKLQEIAGGYKEWHLTYKGIDCLARVHKMMMTGSKDSNPQWFMLKFANQDGKAHLSSPVFLRWGEVVLNRAEAEAKLSMDDDALADVNMIRKRAGIPAEGMFATGNPETMHGYTSVLDIVLDERRLELAFEGHRMFDMMRNERNIDRRYPGANPWEVVPYNRERLQYPIPFSEWSVSGIKQNPGY